MQEDIHVGEEVVAHLRCSHDIEACLMVVTYLVRRSPDGATACRELVVVHYRRDGAVAIIRSISCGVHVAVID